MISFGNLIRDWERYAHIYSKKKAIHDRFAKCIGHHYDNYEYICKNIILSSLKVGKSTKNDIRSTKKISAKIWERIKNLKTILFSLRKPRLKIEAIKLIFV